MLTHKSRTPCRLQTQFPAHKFCPNLTGTLVQGKKAAFSFVFSPDVPVSEIQHQIECPPTNKTAAYLLSTLSRYLTKHDGRTASNCRLSTSRMAVPSVCFLRHFLAGTEPQYLPLLCGALHFTTIVDTAVWCNRQSNKLINLLKPTGHVMHQQV